MTTPATEKWMEEAEGLLDAMLEAGPSAAMLKPIAAALMAAHARGRDEGLDKGLEAAAVRVEIMQCRSPMLLIASEFAAAIRALKSPAPRPRCGKTTRPNDVHTCEEKGE